MNIKSLLLGSAAALAVVSGAQAADAIVAAEPEPAEYVRVCDAFGTGYFYIPGTETCLKIAGRVRIQQAIGDDFEYAPATTGLVKLSAISSSDLGDIEGYAEISLAATKSIKWDYADSPNGEIKTGDSLDVGGGATMGDIYIKIGGLKLGRYGGLWDDASFGEGLGFGSVPGEFKAQFTGSAGAASFGIQLDDLGADALGGVVQAGTKAGDLGLNVYAAYDADKESAAIKAIASYADAKVGLAWYDDNGGAYAEGTREWSIAAAYDIKASDKLTITPDFTYFQNHDNSEGWVVGAIANYVIADGLSTKLNVTYNDADTVGGWVRLERNF